MVDSHDLGLILESNTPLVVIETYEEKRALDMILQVAKGLRRPVHSWSVTEGLKRLSFGPQLMKPTELDKPQEALEHIRTQMEAAIYVLCDFHPFFEDDPKIVRLVKDIALNHGAIAHTVVFISHKLNLPAEIGRYSASMKLALPSDEEIMSIIREEALRWSKAKGGGRVKTDNKTLQRLVTNLKGLTRGEVKRLVYGAIVDDGAITEEDLPEVNKAKFALMDMESVLNFEYRTEQFSNVGGLHNLKSWLSQRRDAFLDPQPDRDIPKGILLLGVQGGGKSLAAKAVAGLWQLPLLRLDMGALYNKYFGETERNLRECLSLADTMAPCVVWLDEIEKSMAGGGSDNGTSKRVLGTLLTWMSEREKPAFLVATSNDISGLPPELVRKGRFDEIFFVDLPSLDIRREIFEIHLKKRNISTSHLNLGDLAKAAEGFSGAEIEQAIVSACYAEQGENRDIDQDTLLMELSRTRPLSVVMAEQVAALRHWAKERAVPA